MLEEDCVGVDMTACADEIDFMRFGRRREERKGWHVWSITL